MNIVVDREEFGWSGDDVFITMWQWCHYIQNKRKKEKVGCDIHHLQMAVYIHYFCTKIP